VCDEIGLDAATTPDDGDPVESACDSRAERARLSNWRVVVGCCGSDHRHVAAICQEFEQGRRYRGGREPVVDDQGRSAGSAPGAASVCASSTGTLR